jgi:ketosteroid isomerase-like protein
MKEMNMRHQALPLIALVLSLGVWSCANNSKPQEPIATATAATAPAPAEDVEGTITQLEKDWVAAIQKKDTATLDRILAPDFVGTSPTAHTFMKDDAIGDIKDSRYVVDKMNLDEVSVNVYGDTAVSFTSQEEKSKYEGKDTSGHYHFTDTWVKKDGKWQVVASHGTRYAGPTAGEKAKAK